MEKAYVLLILLMVSRFIFSQENTNASCKTEPIILEKLFCSYCENEGESNVETTIVDAKYAYFDFQGTKAIDVMLWINGTKEKPHYVVNIIIPEVSLSTGNLESEIIDEWGNGLDNDNSVIVKFRYLADKASYLSQWSNWGGHNKGDSEGTVKLEMQEDGSICGSFKVRVWEDGSSLRKEKHSVIYSKGFVATQ
jgi:hypothetical protein